MNPHSDTRRSFVKKTLATTVTYSFVGLIKANGAPNGTTTHSTTVGTSTTISPWETTSGITYATTAPWETTQNTNETTVLTNNTTATTIGILYEYALKCTSDPSCPGGGGSSEWGPYDDNYGEGYIYGATDGAIGLDPGGWGDNATLTCIVAGAGAVKGQQKTSFTISSKVTSKWDNPGVNYGGALLGELNKEASSCSAITIFLPDPDEPLVQVSPQYQVTVNTSAVGYPKIQAHHLAIPAVIVTGSASYEDEGADVKIKQVIPETGTEIEWDGKAKNFKVGPLIIAWNFVLLKRRRGSEDPWEMADPQPECLTHGNTPNPS